MAEGDVIWTTQEFERVWEIYHGVVQKRCIRGYHVYKEMWELAAGEVLEYVREPHNVQGLYAVALKIMGTIMGHLPRRLSRVCAFFLQWTGTISYTVTGGRRYSVDLYILLNLLSCTVHKSACVILYCKLSLFKLLSIKFCELNFRCSLAQREYFNNEIFPNDGTFLVGSPSFQSFRGRSKLWISIVWEMSYYWTC